jgi:hypothetical protein
MNGNMISKLAEEPELYPRWLALLLIFHTPLVAGSKPARQFYLSHQTLETSVKKENHETEPPDHHCESARV